ncbi:AAA family ATPase [Leucothrix arctica]|uniref:AAA family ATPase n=1 Tax=Leucothrix arctica TaxID=1481894 RepID=A0A317CIL7_9GAMM|nr:MoxR family ATPase [Leucothrix arctica]PWQ98405.1 AAA family ATPase [Leucothrix arctica]
MSMQIEQVSELVTAIKTEISHAVIGQEDVIHQTLIALIAGGNVLIEGVPGLGKTLLVRALAKTFEGEFSRIQFTPDLMPADVTGHTLVDLKTNEFNLRRGPVFTNLLLADEINRAPAKTQSALLEVMQERQVTIEGESHPVPLPFMTLATQNPLEQEGTYPLPEAQLDRFLLKVFMEYPSTDEESLMVAAVTNKQTGDQLNLSRVKAVASPADILALQAAAAEIRADQQVIDYAVNLVRATRTWQGLSIGAGPRGSISLIRAARAEAMINLRDFITPDDIKAIALPVLRHRVALAPEMELEGYSTDQILTSVINSIDAPRQ